MQLRNLTSRTNAAFICSLVISMSGMLLSGARPALAANAGPSIAAPQQTTTAPAPLPLPLNDVYAINAGGSATSGYTADELFSGGKVFRTNASIYLGQATIPAPAAVYQTAREGQKFSYTFSGLQPHIGYAVILHFAELYWTLPLQREFNVDINNVRELTDFDIAEITGGRFEATDQFFQVSADSTGTIKIDFSKGSYDQPTINGIEIRGDNN